MSAKIAITAAIFLAILNGNLFLSNQQLTGVLEAEIEKQGSHEKTAGELERAVEEVTHERNRLESLRIQFSKLLAGLKSRENIGSNEPGRSGGTELTDESFGLDIPVPSELQPKLTTSDLLAMEPLSSDEHAYLNSVRDSLPDLSDGHLQAQDLEGLLANPLWNPDQRELSAGEREELEQLLSDYVFFARQAHFDVYHEDVLPEVDFLEEAGAYWEGAPEEPRPQLEDASISHGKVVEDENGNPRVRIFYFHEADYPELYHKKQIATEQAYSTLIGVYQLINSNHG